MVASIRYERQLAVVDRVTNTQDELLQRTMFTKTEQWAYEREPTKFLKK
jgi:hypothetical protein